MRRYRKFKRNWRRKARRRGRRPRITKAVSKYNNNHIFYVKRTYELTPVVLNDHTGADQAAGVAFTLDQLPNYTEFTNLFDQYQITGILVRFLWSNNNSQFAFSQYVNDLKPWYFTSDKDDATTPASINAMLERPNTQIRRPLGEHKLFFRPGVATAVYKGAFTGYGQAKKGTWLDCSNADIQHFALKYYIQSQGPANYTPTLFMYATYYMKFRGIL